MTTRKEDQAKAIFLDAIELDLEEDRRAHIEAECGDDELLRNEVEELFGDN